MKARVLKKLLNDTKYTISNNDGYIAVGSPMCHDLIKVDKETLKISYALDTFREGRSSLRNKELIFIWDKLTEIIASGEIQDIIDGNDVLENPLPVFTIEDDLLVETFTDKYGWPNNTISGELMHDNEYFDNKKDALISGIKDCGYAIKNYKDRINDLENDLLKYKRKLSQKENSAKELKQKLKSL